MDVLFFNQVRCGPAIMSQKTIILRHQGPEHTAGAAVEAPSSSLAAAAASPTARIGDAIPAPDAWTLGILQSSNSALVVLICSFSNGDPTP